MSARQFKLGLLCCRRQTFSECVLLSPFHLTTFHPFVLLYDIQSLYNTFKFAVVMWENSNSLKEFKFMHDGHTWSYILHLTRELLVSRFPEAWQAPQCAPPPRPPHLASTLGSASPASTSGTWYSTWSKRERLPTRSSFTVHCSSSLCSAQHPPRPPLFPPPPQPRAFRSGLMFQLCVSICTVVMFDVAFIIQRVSKKKG